jgi:ribosomal protein S18 acetylase RimI-like enzyme
MTAENLSNFLKGMRDNNIETREQAMISSRLDSNKKAEIDLLQEVGFRFVELSLHPELTGLQTQVVPSENLEIVTGSRINLNYLTKIAESSFLISRFHRDPLVPAGFANQRFVNWVKEAAKSDRKTILQIQDPEGAILGFFVTRRDDSTHSYWELTALDSKYQGKSLGRAAWNTVLKHEHQLGVDTVRTTISAENLQVVGMYPRLGFKFSGSSVVLHYSSSFDS